jgi:penicillin-binding protein 2
MTRLRIINRLIIAGFLVLCLALIYYQVIQFSKYQQLSQSNRIRILPQSARRGLILDRNGNILADDALFYNLLIMPRGRNCPVEQISKLSQILLISEQELKSRYNKGYIAPFVPVLLCKGISRLQAVTIGQLKYDLPQVVIDVNPRRIYPLGRIGSHVLGYLGQIDAWRLEQLREYGYKMKDLVGCSGIEEVYDYILHSHDGGMQVEVDNKGRVSRILGLKAAEDGKDIELTIDLRLQRIIYDNLRNHTGCVIILNPVNGEVLAMVSFPDFNPQVFQDGSPSLLNRLFNDPDAPLLNRAINGLYPPGSIFKIVLAAAGLEKGKIDSNSKFFCSGSMQIGNRRFRCWDAHGEQDIVGALARSCNVFFYNLGLRLGPQLINEYALKFGLKQSTGIDLNGESKGFLPCSLWERIKRRHSWFPGDTANLSIGQGEVLVTPLQIAQIMAALANGGKLIKPRLLKSINPDSQVIDSPAARAVNLPLSKETLQIIRRGLIAAVNEPGGTAGFLANLGISIAGKTGTAQVDSGRAHGWFAGYFPVDEPRFVICVFLEHAGSGYYCCQLTEKIIKQMIAEGLL